MTTRGWWREARQKIERLWSILGGRESGYAPHSFNDFGEDPEARCMDCGVRRKDKAGGCPGARDGEGSR